MILNEENILSSIEVELATPPQKSVIWLHGLGADGNDFVPFVTELQLPQTEPVRFVFPNAPIMPITINNGYKMRAWHDIYGFSFNSKIDKPGIQQSIALIKELIAKEMARGIASENIIIGGFSQGAAMALLTGLHFTAPLGGIIALSGYLPLAEEFVGIATANQNIPIFLAHGTEDMVVPYALGKAAYALLTQAGYPVNWHSYAMPHSVCTQEINDISQWMQARWHQAN